LPKFIITICFIFIFWSVQCQDKDSDQVYHFNYAWELPATVAGYGLNFYGLDLLKDKTRLDSASIMQLNVCDIPKFDRWVTEIDPGHYDISQTISDRIMQVSLLLPAVLAIDPKIRNDWVKLLALYLETHAVSANLYVWAGPMSHNRVRPFVYNPDAPMEKKLDGGSRDAFFSGHTSWTATATFFMAKVYSDYHPELGNKKYWLFAAALIPPLAVASFRIYAGKHFPTDVLTGLTVGAACGILIPHLHKQKKNKSLSMIPYFGGVNGMALTYKF